MRSPYIVGLAAGLIAALVFASASTGPALLRVVLFLLTPLPLFLAGLGWGWRAAAVGTTAPLVVIGLAVGPIAALVFTLSQALPAAYLCYLAGLSRTDDRGQLEWYPVGRMVAVAALMAGAISLGSLLMLGTDIATIKSALKPLVEAFAKEQMPRLGQPALGEAEVEQLAELAVYVMPAALGVSSLGGLLFNLWLAGRVAAASGQLQRPWPDIPAMEFPRWMPGVFAIGIGLTFLPGFPALLGASVSGPLLLAYVLLGLAIIHYVTRGASWRGFALWGLYIALFVLNAGLPLVLALVGLIDTIRPLRGPAPPPGPPSALT